MRAGPLIRLAGGMPDREDGDERGKGRERRRHQHERAAASRHADQNDRGRKSPLPEGRMLGDHLVFPILLTKDLNVSRAFYHGTLGLEVAREDPDRIMFRCGGGSLLALSLSTTGTRDAQTQIAWRVPDLKAELADLRRRGVKIEEYDAPDPKTTDGIADMGFAWAAWFIDPSQNVLGIIQPKVSGVSEVSG